MFIYGSSALNIFRTVFYCHAGLRLLVPDMDFNIVSEHDRLEAEQQHGLRDDSSSSGTPTTRSGGSTDYSDDDRQSVESLTSWDSESDSAAAQSVSLTISPACSLHGGEDDLSQ